MGVIRLNGMHFYAFHGCFAEEQEIGTHFDVDVTLHVDVSKACQTDDILDTVNYLAVYRVVQQEMMRPSHLLEHVASRIADAILSLFTDVESVDVQVAKLNPPLGGHLDSVSLCITKNRSIAIHSHKN